MSETEKAILQPVAQSDRGDARNHPDFLFWCPGCQCCHGVWTTKPNYLGARWGFDGNLDHPTFSPSIVTRSENSVCHLFVRNGTIQFLTDSTHALAGKTVPMEKF